MIRRLVIPLLVSLAATASASLVPGVPWKRTEGNVRIEHSKAYEPRYNGDAPWPASFKEMGAILTCPYGITPQSDVVLLVHGTGSNGLESWKDVYVPVLRDDGYTPCWVDLPQRSMQDNQITAGFVAYNVHLISRYTGKKVAIVAHSSGGAVAQWGLTFWPSVRPHVSAFIPLGPDFQGVQFDGISKLCSIGGKMLCSPTLWQQFHGSTWMKVLNETARVAVVPTTVIWTYTDQIVIPATQTSILHGAKRISVQHVCPVRVTDHYLLIFDAVVYSLVLDALKNGGIADPDRIPGKTCLKVLPKGADFHVSHALTAFIHDVKLGMLGQKKVPAEPAIAPYVSNWSGWWEWNAQNATRSPFYQKAEMSTPQKVKQGIKNFLDIDTSG